MVDDAARLVAWLKERERERERDVLEESKK